MGKVLADFYTIIALANTVTCFPHFSLRVSSVEQEPKSALRPKLPHVLLPRLTVIIGSCTPESVIAGFTAECLRRIHSTVVLCI